MKSGSKRNVTSGGEPSLANLILATSASTNCRFRSNVSSPFRSSSPRPPSNRPAQSRLRSLLSLRSATFRKEASRASMSANFALSFSASALTSSSENSPPRAAGARISGPRSSVSAASLQHLDTVRYAAPHHRAGSAGCFVFFQQAAALFARSRRSSASYTGKRRPTTRRPPPFPSIFACPCPQCILRPQAIVENL